MRTEVTKNKNGSLDEVKIFDDKNECVFHLEQMSSTHWWMGCYGGHTVLINLASEQKITATVEHRKGSEA